MGGYLSTRWGGYRRRLTVGEVESKDVNKLRRLSRAVGRSLHPDGVRLTSKPQRRGVRLYYVCPRCARLCGVVYRPNGQRWACRTCHDLTYASAQCRTKPPRAFAYLAAQWELDRRIEKVFEKRSAGKKLTRRERALIDEVTAEDDRYLRSQQQRERRKSSARRAEKSD